VGTIESGPIDELLKSADALKQVPAPAK